MQGVRVSAGWLITVASRRMTDQVRSEIARRRREETVAANEVPINEPATPGLVANPLGTTTTR